MKHSKFSRILALALILTLLIIAIPAPPMLAQSLTASATTTLSGTTVTVGGTGLSASSVVYIYFPDQSTLKTSASTDGTGYFYTTFNIGEYPAGNKTVWVKDGSTWYTTSFSVTPIIGMNTSSGYVGDQVTVNGTGFAANKYVTIYFDDEELGSASTNSNGSFTNATFSVPASPRGSYTVKAKDASNYSDTDIFSIQQKITVTPTSASVGDEVTVVGTAFRASKVMTFYFDGAVVTTTPSSVSSDSYGGFTAKFAVPSADNGTYKVKASDGSYNYEANLTVQPGVDLNQTSGHVGSEVTLSGTGFIASGTVHIKYDGVEITTASVNSSGVFSATFDIPASVGGTHTITATDGTSTVLSTFTMETTAPSAPTLVSPIDIERASSQATLDWENVTDLSEPVTYKLEVAFDSNFSLIALTKTGLTDSEYTILKEEKLESTSKDEPYYWRVKAIDAASNQSQWSTSGSFYVGFSLSLPTWATYTLLGVGGLLLLGLGFYLGRRTAY